MINSIKLIRFLVITIVIASAIATISAIFSHDGPGRYQHKSIRGQQVTIYGEGLYEDMSAEVAPQGLAQDHITLLAGIPLLVISFLMARNGSIKGRYLLAGTLGYFLVTYLFYLVMGMYNSMFLAYVILLSASFFAFFITMQTFKTERLPGSFDADTPTTSTGGFLIFNSIAIALLWLSIVVPPLIDGSIIPLQVEHYTTLIVQGLDLAILLPASFISGLLLIKRKPSGYLYAPVYLVFLSLLMSALTAKVIAMSFLGYNVMPAIFIIPAFNLVSVICTIVLMKHIKKGSFIEAISS
jgi:hypothetical protein